MENACPKVSVLVPMYNVEKLLPRCVESLKRQSLKDIEIILVNDASPDGSLALARRYAAADSRIRVIDKPVNESLMMARRTGIEAARGEWIFFLDSDDYIPDNTLEELYRVASASEADIVVGDMYLENLEGRHVLRPRAHVAGPDGMTYLQAILSWTTCSLCGSLYRRPMLLTPGLPALKGQLYSEDRILLTALLIMTRPQVVYAPVTSYFYCLNAASATRVKLSDDRLRAQLEALCRCHQYVSEHAPEMSRYNDNFLLRYLSLYLEKGYNRNIIRNFNDTTRRLLQFPVMKATAGTRFAGHTWMALHSALYNRICTAARLTIRKLQGKD